MQAAAPVAVLDEQQKPRFPRRIIFDDVSEAIAKVSADAPWLYFSLQVALVRRSVHCICCRNLRAVITSHRPGWQKGKVRHLRNEGCLISHMPSNNAGHPADVEDRIAAPIQ